MAASDDRRRWRFFAVALAVPTLGSSLGIDGGAIFQIVAVESLRLDPRAVGIAFGLGVLSVPLQLLAARTPLWRARRNLQLFLAFAAVQCWVLALLVHLDLAGGFLALLALPITVVAEISLSVLYAPAWQPLISHALTSAERQTVNSRVRAAAGLAAAATVVAFGAAGDDLRTILLLVVGAVALRLAVAGRHLPGPERPVPQDAADVAGPAVRPSLPPGLRAIYLALGLGGTVMWPMFLVYVHEVLWPTANLGLLGATQLGGALLAAATWRSTSGDVNRRALAASLVLAVATAALAAVRPPSTSAGEGVVVFASLFAAAAAVTTVFMALLERAHREVDDETSVKALTILDVVASTSLQAGLLVAGFLISMSTSRTEWLIDPYRLYLLVGALSLVLVLARALAADRT